MKNLLSFEKKVLAGLKKCGILPDSVSEKSPLGLAVSGGADSVSLLLAAHEIFESACLRVITVNHGIRSSAESGGDADFVQDLCRSLEIKCSVVAVENGKIAESAALEKRSVEEVAREFRYRAFDSFIKEENLLFLCLAHNQNDQLETLLMRFLQGSSCEGLCGIARVREKFCRPLLEIPRSEIESYLVEKKQSWRTDATNSELKYLRNKVRNVLVPVLNENFSGWQKALLSGAEKASADEDFIKKETLRVDFKGTVCELDRNQFFSLHDALKRRVFFSALNETGFGGRFPFRVFEEILSWENADSRELCFDAVKILLNSQKLVISYDSEHRSDDEKNAVGGGFSFLLKDVGDRAEIHGISAEIRNGMNLVIKSENCDEIALPLRFSCLVRSFVPGDKIQTADGKFKALAQIFSDWKIPAEVREKIPVVEELCPLEEGESRIVAFIASPFGLKNWIVDFHNL
ncbi:tRNA lysidine(34) synthetase TilS [uncultured Treponema sp.]|uniref:tRNA lysidine(34) synthetase TilS n=1 Tax=uncultured Treponema sp. TaxID=162155 RepID=UPI0025D9E9BC|nr:tRNA lysidine(34) synthetase TilS [uncultured Treponema sp.]